MPLQSPLAPSTNATRGNNQGQVAVAAELVVNGSCTSSMVYAAAKKESGVAKAQADKKKIDARKRSLKRL